MLLLTPSRQVFGHLGSGLYGAPLSFPRGSPEAHGLLSEYLCCSKTAPGGLLLSSFSSASLPRHTLDHLGSFIKDGNLGPTPRDSEVMELQ